MGRAHSALSSAFVMPNAGEGSPQSWTTRTNCVISAALGRSLTVCAVQDDGRIVILSPLVIPSEVEESLTIMLDKGETRLRST